MGNTAEVINTLFPNFKFVNTGTTPINLGDVKLKYFFPTAGPQPMNFDCDYIGVGVTNITGTFVPFGRPSTSNYLEIGFTSAPDHWPPKQAPGLELDLQVGLARLYPNQRLLLLPRPS